MELTFNYLIKEDEERGFEFHPKVYRRLAHGFKSHGCLTYRKEHGASLIICMGDRY
jgi:hypothetical protein